MKNVVGNPARGENFFRREREVRKILTSISNGNNIQIAAPRRVGKTSILFHMLDEASGGYKYVYVDTESIDAEEDFYKKLLKEILKLPGMQRAGEKFLKTANSFARRIKGLKILEVGIDFEDDHVAISYYEDLVHFLSGIELDTNEQLIILIDEFPQTILNILARHGIDATTRFLQSNRTLRINPDILDKVRFIYTGSVGLNHTVAAIDSTAFINDLNTLEIEPLGKEEAALFLAGLLATRGVVIRDIAREHLLKKLEWLIPFHIQLLVQELLRMDLSNSSVDCHHVDLAFEEIVSTRNDNHFVHYYSRLKTQFKGQELKYVSEILRIMADSGCISQVELFDKAVFFEVDGQYRKIIAILVYDGYIHHISNENVYRFNSPIVRMWWLKYVY